MELIHQMAFQPHNLFILGSVGSGKTALAFTICEKIHEMNPDRPVYLSGYPDVARDYLPDYIHFENDIKKVPYDAIILKDDTSLDDATHSKGAAKSQKEFSQEMALCRQKRHTIVFTIQNTYWMSLDLERAGNNHYAFKYYDQRAIVRERPEIQGNLFALMKVMDDYVVLEGYDSREITYFSSKFYNGFMRSSVPSYWTQNLSEVLGRSACVVDH